MIRERKIKQDIREKDGEEMQQWITNVLTKYMGDWYFPQVGVTDILEILIISVIVYQIMKWIMNTKAWMLLRGNIDAWSVHSLRGIFSDEYDFVSGREVDQCAGDRGGGRISAGTAPSA